MSQAVLGAWYHQWEVMVSYGNSVEMRRAQMSSLSTLRGATSLWGANSTECLLCFEWEMAPTSSRHCWSTMDDAVLGSC